MSAAQSEASGALLTRATSKAFAALRATTQWTLCFALSFAVTAGVLILAHV